MGSLVPSSSKPNQFRMPTPGPTRFLATSLRAWTARVAGLGGKNSPTGTQLFPNALGSPLPLRKPATTLRRHTFITSMVGLWVVGMSKFKVGDRVHLFKLAVPKYGEVIEIDPEDNELPALVRLDSGYNNWYPFSDMRLVDGGPTFALGDRVVGVGF